MCKIFVGFFFGSISVLPLHLLEILLLPSLRLHLLHFNSVGLAAAHVELMVTHAQSQNTLVDAQPWSIEYKVLQWKHLRHLKCLIVTCYY